MTDDTPTNALICERETRDLTGCRVIPASLNRVYRAFVDPDELARWMHPPGASAEIHPMESQVGGTYPITMHGEAPDGGVYTHTYGGTFQELVPSERIVQTEAPGIDDPADAEEMTVTVTFDEIPKGSVKWPRLFQPFQIVGQVWVRNGVTTSVQRFTLVAGCTICWDEIRRGKLFVTIDLFESES